MGFARSAARLVVLVALGVGVGLVGNALHPVRMSLSTLPFVESTTCQSPSATLPPSVQWMSVAAAKERLSLFSELVVGDTRSELEYQQDHIPHAIHLPCKVGLDQALPMKNAPLLLYDQRGDSSGLIEASTAAQKAGFLKIFLLRGGFQKWKAQQGEVESGPCPRCSAK